MTIEEHIKEWLNRISKIKDLKQREEHYKELIEYLKNGWQETNAISCIMEAVIKEMLTKEQYIDFQREVLHRNIRNNKWLQKQDDLMENEREIQKDFIKKYRIIDIKDLKRGKDGR